MSLKFSLLIPTRERTTFLGPLLESIITTAKEPQNLEILFGVDDDDRTSQKKVKFYIEDYKGKLNIRLLTRRRTIFLNRDYYAWLGFKATGDLLWVLGDDIRFYIPEWDIIIGRSIEHYFETHPDRIVCASIRDNTPKPNQKLPKFPCFPLFSKEAFKVSGMLLHPKIPTWGADYVAYMTYKPIDRLLEFNDRVYLNHKSYHTKQVEADKTAKRIGAIFNQLKNVPVHNIQRILREEVPFIRKKLQLHIDSFKVKEKK